MKKKILGLLVISFGVVGGFLMYYQEGFWATVGSNMVNSILVSFIWSFFISELDEEKQNKKINEHFKRIEKVISLKNKKLELIDSAGLKHINKDRSHLTNQIEDILQHSKSSIKILGESLNSFTDRPDFDENIIGAIKRGIDVKIVLCSLYSPSLDERYKELNLKKEESIGLHKNTLKTYYSYYKHAINNNYTMKLFTKHPKLILVIVDDKHVYVQHYSYGMKGYEAPLLEFTEGELGIENYYLKFFNNVWNDIDTKEAKDEEKDFS